MSADLELDFESFVLPSVLAQGCREGIQRTREGRPMNALRGKIRFYPAERLEAWIEPGHPFNQAHAEYAKIPLGIGSGHHATVELHLYSDGFRTLGRIEAWASGPGARGTARKFLVAAISGLQSVDASIPLFAG